MFSDFDKAFKNGQRFDNIKLTELYPCSKCKYEKELSKIDELKTWTGKVDKRRKKLLHDCIYCEKIVTYRKNCYDKLKEYENIDISIEKLRKLKENNIKK